MAGLWPLKVDASGCKKPEQAPQTKYDHPTRKGPTNSKPLLLSDQHTTSADSKDLLDGGPARKAKAEDDPSQEGGRVKKIKAEEDLQSKSEGGVADAVSEVRKASPQSPAESNSALSSESTAGGVQVAKTVDPESHDSVVSKSSGARALVKRDVSTDSASKPAECEPQGLVSPPYTSNEDFGIGGQADSTYEYLPKEYMLLGGLEEKYQVMYEMAAESIISNLLFRPMIRDEKRHILHAGLAKVSDKKSPIDDKTILQPEGTHLTCFAGAMFAIGAKIFDRKDDMDIASKLTDGCVWAYEATETGIMPESYLAIPCADKKNCPWNETLWHEKLDPFGDLREKNRLSRQQAILKSEKRPPVADPVGKGDEVSQTEGAKASLPPGLVSSQTEGSSGDKDSSNSKSNLNKTANPKATGVEEITDDVLSKPKETAGSAKRLDRRQLGDLNEDEPIAPAVAVPEKPKDTMTKSTVNTAEVPVVEKSSAEQHLEKSKAATASLQNKDTVSKPSNGTVRHTGYTPPPIPTREEFVKARISDERLPAGMTKITGGRYLLR